MAEVWMKYCDDVLNGLIPSGSPMINAVTRFLDDLKRVDLEFRVEAVKSVIDFIASSKHYSGEHEGKNFIQEPWEQFLTANLYGFYWKESGKRRFRVAYIEIARKNGKTALVAGYALNGLVNDNEAGAEVLIAANSKDQAKIAFGAVKGFAKSIDPNEKYLKRYRADVLYPNTNSFIKVLAADADKMDGYSCSLGIIDEYHAAPNPLVRDVLRSSQGMRKNPQLITITTGGFDKSLPCWELRTIASEIAAGIKTDDSFFSAIFTMDENDDWMDPENWIKSNPNLGITIHEDYLGQQVTQAINSPADEVGIKTKNFNIWCDSAITWIPDEYVIKATKPLRMDDFIGLDCYIGVDLSSNQDLTAVSYMFEKDDLYYFFIDFYLPSDSLRSRPDKELYRDWVNRKFMKVTPGNVTDYEYITKDLLEADKKFNIVKIYYDQYNATQWAIQCTEERLFLEPFSQTIGNFNSCTKGFERLILKNQLFLQDNPIIRYCLRNVELRMDFNGNVKPNKNSEKKKIDGVIAALQALAAYMKYSGKTGTNIF